jgi:hypothetical protein
VNTSPSIDDMLEGVITAISTDIVPSLSDPKAHATAAMMQSLLQTVRQVLPNYVANLVDEHNDMTRVLREVAAAMDGVSGDVAGRFAERGTTLGQWHDRPTPADPAELTAAHRELTESLAASMRDLDELQRAGLSQADEALQIIRGHLGSRYLRDVATVTVGGGMVGRG